MEENENKSKSQEPKDVPADITAPPGKEKEPLGPETDPNESVGGSESTVTSGIGSSSVVSGKSSDSISDVASVSSGGTVQSNQGPSRRILGLSQRGEWMILDQLLRTLSKGHPDINEADEVR